MVSSFPFSQCSRTSDHQNSKNLDLLECSALARIRVLGCSLKRTLLALNAVSNISTANAPPTKYERYRDWVLSIRAKQATNSVRITIGKSVYVDNKEVVKQPNAAPTKSKKVKVSKVPRAKPKSAMGIAKKLLILPIKKTVFLLEQAPSFDR